MGTVDKNPTLILIMNRRQRLTWTNDDPVDYTCLCFTWHQWVKLCGSVSLWLFSNMSQSSVLLPLTEEKDSYTWKTHSLYWLVHKMMDQWWLCSSKWPIFLWGTDITAINCMILIPYCAREKMYSPVVMNMLSKSLLTACTNINLQPLG